MSKPSTVCILIIATARKMSTRERKASFVMSLMRRRPFWESFFASSELRLNFVNAFTSKWNEGKEQHKESYFCLNDSFCGEAQGSGFKLILLFTKRQ
jgi:hypothetical protein